MSQLKSWTTAAGTRLILLLLLICAATIGIEGSARPSDDTARKDITAAFDRYVAGWRSGNVESLATVYADDARVSAYWPDPSRPKLIMGWPAISSNLNNIFARIHDISSVGMDLDFNERDIELYGNMAILTSSWVWNHPADPAFATGRATFIFERRGKKWVIVHEHSSVTPFDSGR